MFYYSEPSKSDPNTENMNFFLNRKLVFTRSGDFLIAANEMNHRPNFILNLKTNESFYAEDYDVETNQEFVNKIIDSQKDN